MSPAANMPPGCRTEVDARAGPGGGCRLPPCSPAKPLAPPPSPLRRPPPRASGGSGTRSARSCGWCRRSPREFRLGLQAGAVQLTHARDHSATPLAAVRMSRMLTTSESPGSAPAPRRPCAPFTVRSRSVMMSRTRCPRVDLTVEDVFIASVRGSGIDLERRRHLAPMPTTWSSAMRWSIARTLIGSPPRLGQRSLPLHRREVGACGSGSTGSASVTRCMLGFARTAPDTANLRPAKMAMHLIGRLSNPSLALKRLLGPT